MKLMIFPEKCIACGLCEAIAPKYFDYHDDGIVKFLQQDERQSQIVESDSELLLALKQCPTRAIIADKAF